MTRTVTCLSSTPSKTVPLILQESEQLAKERQEVETECEEVRLTGCTPPHLKMNKCPSEKFIFQPSIFMGDCTQNGHFLVPLDVVDVLLKNAMMVTMDFYGKWKGNFTSYIWMLWEKHSTQSFFFSPWYWMQGTTWGNGLGTTIQDVFGGHGGWSKDHSAWSEVGFSLFFVRVFKVSIFFFESFFFQRVGWGGGWGCV